MLRPLVTALALLIALPAGSVAAAPRCTTATPLIAWARQRRLVSTVAEAARLKNISSFDEKLGSLDGIECFTALEGINIQGAGIQDLRPLAGLTQLQSLDLRHNQVQDLSPLAGLTRLKYLDLGDNQVDDIGVLAGLDHLSDVRLPQNRIRDLRGLVGKAPRQLVELHLGHNQIRDLTPLAGLDFTYLMRLDLSDNGIATLPALVFTSVQTLFVDLSGNAIADLRPLDRWQPIDSLNLARNRITDLRPLAAHARLTVLDVSHNPVAALPADLPFLGRLQVLRLDETEISDATPLRRLPRTVELHLYPGKICDASVLQQASIPIADLKEKDACRCPHAGFGHLARGTDCSERNPIVAAARRLGTIRCEAEIHDVRALGGLDAFKDLDGVQCFHNLEELDLEARQLHDLRPLTTLTKLKKLRLARNRVQSLAPLTGLLALEELDLSENTLVADLAPLARLTRLTTLKLAGNQIADVAALGRLVRLQVLDLSDNRVAQIDALAGLTALEELRLSRNRIRDVTPIARLQPKLRSLDLEQNQIPGRPNQYRGSCLQILTRLRAGQLQRPLRDVFAICPAWEDAEVAAVLKLGGGARCRLERICDDIAGVDCGAAIDGPYDYHDLHTWDVISECGGRCMGGRCTNCPPRQMRCPRY